MLDGQHGQVVQQGGLIRCVHVQDHLHTSDFYRSSKDVMPTQGMPGTDQAGQHGVSILWGNKIS